MENINIFEIEEIYETEDDFIEEDYYELDEELEERVRIKKVVHGGKVIKRTISSKAGFKIVGGKEKKMTSAEKRKRKIAQKKAARKRKAKHSTIQRKTRISKRKGKRIKKRFYR